MKSVYHVHSRWCDGAATPRELAEAALAHGFDVLGFSSHAMLPGEYCDWTVTAAKAPAYAAEIRALASEYAPRLKILLGFEADYLADSAVPDRRVYAPYRPDYLIGSVHFVRGADGVPVPVDHTPELLQSGIRDHFGGSAEAFVRAYFRAEREMVERYDFDLVGHPDLVRKFNRRHPYFDETAAWYREEVEQLVAAIARSGKKVEVNTGAIARGWLDEAYPAADFRAQLRAAGVGLVLNSDAHRPEALDCAFERFAGEAFVELVGA